MNKFEKQVVTKLNKKLEKYGISREELELKLHSGAVYGSTVMKMVDNMDKPFCQNHDVACGNYDCNYADVVNNTIICNAKNCNHQSIYTPSKLTDEEEEDECLSCPYFDVEAPDCCKYAPEACYYDPDPDTYPF